MDKIPVDKTLGASKPMRRSKSFSALSSLHFTESTHNTDWESMLDSTIQENTLDPGNMVRSTNPLSTETTQIAHTLDTSNNPFIDKEIPYISYNPNNPFTDKEIPYISYNPNNPFIDKENTFPEIENTPPHVETLETQHKNLQTLDKYNKDLTALKGMDQSLRGADMPKGLADELKKARECWESHINMEDNKQKFNAQIQLRLNEIGTSYDMYITKLDKPNQEKLYDIYIKLDDKNIFLSLFKEKIKDNSDINEKDAEDNFNINNKLLTDTNTILKDNIPENYYEDLKKIKTAHTNHFNMYKKQEISGAKFDLHNAYMTYKDSLAGKINAIHGKYLPELKQDPERLYKMNEKLKDIAGDHQLLGKLKTDIEKSCANLDTSIQTKHAEFMKQFVKNWKETVEKGKFTENQEYISSMNDSINNLNTTFNNYSEKDMSQEKGKLYNDYHLSFKGFTEVHDKMPDNIKKHIGSPWKPGDTPSYRNLDDIKRSLGGEFTRQYDEFNNKIKENKENYQNKAKPNALSAATWDNYIKSLQDNIVKREQQLKDFIAKLPEDVETALKQWKAVAENLDNLEKTWEILVEDHEKKVYSTLNPEQKIMFEQREEISKQKIETLKQDLADALKKIETFTNSTGSNKDASKAKGIAKVFKALWSCLRHPFSRKKCQVCMGNAINKAETEVNNTTSGKGKSSARGNFMDFWKSKRGKRALILAATTIAIGVTLGTGGAAAPLILGTMFVVNGTMIWKMMKNDDKEKTREQGRGRQAEFNELTESTGK